MSHKPVYLFILETVIWLPVMFFIWYSSAAWLAIPTGWLADWVLTTFWPNWVSAVETQNYLLDIVTTIHPPKTPPEAVFSFTVNPLLYSYGLPFFMALTLAVPQSLITKFKHIVLSWLLVLLPLHVMGVVFTSLVRLIFKTTPTIAQQIAPQQWMIEVVAIGYQFNTLILPAVVPVVLWMALNQDYVQMLISKPVRANQSS